MLRINKRVENVIYRSPDKADPSKSFDIEMCGVTIPSEGYYMERDRLDKNDPRLVSIFEYVTEGVGYIECNGKIYTVKAGDFYYLDCKHTHRYWADKENPFGKMWINVRGRLPAAMLAAYYFTEPVIVQHMDVSALFREMADALSGIKDNNKTDVYSNVASLICKLIITIGTERQKQRIMSGIAFRIKQEIDRSQNYGITLSEIENKFFLSKSYIIHLFSDEFGITPKQYILQKKIDTAKLLLRDGEKSMCEIAELLNFSSVQHFSSTFRRYAGITPDNFRRSAGGKR